MQKFFGKYVLSSSWAKHVKEKVTPQFPLYMEDSCLRRNDRYLMVKQKWSNTVLSSFVILRARIQVKDPGNTAWGKIQVF